MAHADAINASLEQWENWVLRRHKKIPNNKRLFVLTCMDERVPIEQVLGLQPGDAHIFRNAGGLVTDDVIRSAALTIHGFGTREIIVVTHTECGMLGATGEQVTQSIEQATGVKLSEIALDPGLPEFRLPPESVSRWSKTITDVDQATVQQVEYLRRHPLIPADVSISGYVYEVETGRLRRPGQILASMVSKAFYK